MFEGTLYDGATAIPHAVHAEFRSDALALTQDSGWSDSVEASVLKRLEAEGGMLRLGRSDSPGWRLLLPREASPDVEALLGRGERYGRWIDRIGLVPALIVGGALTASVVALGYFAPQWVAPHVPASWERNVGTAIVGDFGDLRCRDVNGQRALEAMVERVAPGATKGPDAIKVVALDVPIFNAAALPGGHIVVFKPAITESEPDALAGIIAHEVAHVRRRHVTEALIRELGIGALIRLFAGDIGANAEQIVSLSYSRDAETEADGDAIRMLERANVAPKPTAELFAYLSERHESGSRFGTEFLQSHPLSSGRAKRFDASLDPQRHYTPVLTRDQADALFNMCSRRSK